MSAEEQRSQKRRRILIQVLIWLLSFILLVGVIVGSVLLYTETDVIERGISVTQSTGPFAPVVLAAMLFGFSLPVPGHGTFVAASGFILGFWFGSLIVIAASMVGAAFAFEISRRYMYEWIQTRSATVYPKFHAFDQLLISGSFKMVLLVRLVPVPFGMWNVVLGVMAISRKDYLLATFIDLVLMLPQVYVGAQAKSILDMLRGVDQVSLEEKILIGFGLFLSIFATIVLSIYVVVALRKAEREQSKAAPKENEMKLSEGMELGLMSGEESSSAAYRSEVIIPEQRPAVRIDFTTDTVHTVAVIDLHSVESEDRPS
mmetsp:Transcript_8893/g.14566  ORF Transcript_8893/g.14566 Transcript_8893/m.14566 type:complete len:316 (-) Transcript_8893:2289-3236(-)